MRLLRYPEAFPVPDGYRIGMPHGIPLFMPEKKCITGNPNIHKQIEKIKEYVFFKILFRYTNRACLNYSMQSYSKNIKWGILLKKNFVNLADFLQ